MKPICIFTLILPLTLAAETPLQEFTAGNNLFAASIYKEIQKSSKGNFLVSPFSAETILALTQSGAKDATAEELRTALHLPQTQEDVHSALKSLQPSLRQSQLYTLNSANRIYIKEGFKIKDDFKQTAIDVFDADIEEINFNERAAAAKSISDWVEGKTEHKIKDLVSEDDLNDRTRTLLINALYFKGNWSETFAKYATRQEEFFKNGDTAVMVDMMHDTSRRPYFESEDAKFLELEFEGGDVTMTVVLPKEKDGIAKLETNLGKVFERPDYSRESVRVTLPKFKIESTFKFNDILQQLGVRKMFNDDEADLSGIAGDKGDLVVDQVIQKTYIDVNEEGVEAAAATFAAVGVPLSGFVPISPPKEFRADHPFLFYIKVKDLVIFAGRVVDPSQ